MSQKCSRRRFYVCFRFVVSTDNAFLHFFFSIHFAFSIYSYLFACLVQFNVLICEFICDMWICDIHYTPLSSLISFVCLRILLFFFCLCKMSLCSLPFDILLSSNSMVSHLFRMEVTYAKLSQLIKIFIDI